MNDAKLFGYLTNLNDKEFVELFYKVVEKRDKAKSRKGVKWVLATAFFSIDDKTDVEATYFVSLDNEEHYGGPKNWADDICQFGNCRTCNQPTASWAKHHICAICGSEAYGT